MVLHRLHSPDLQSAGITTPLLSSEIINGSDAFAGIALPLLILTVKPSPGFTSFGPPGLGGNILGRSIDLGADLPPGDTELFQLLQTEGIHGIGPAQVKGLSCDIAQDLFHELCGDKAGQTFVTLGRVRYDQAEGDIRMF